MSAITPQTEVRLLKCPIESDNNNQLTFSSKSNQTKYFRNLPHIDVDNFTYQRKDNIIRFPAHIDSILGYNYVMYQNENYTDKWFYAFITKMEYVNDNMTYITIHTDVYQTWMFDMVWKRSFVEREHVNDDTVGLHTVPEGLETGEFTCNNHEVDTHFTDIERCSYILSCTYDIDDYIIADNKYANAKPTKYNGLVNGCKYFRVDNASSLATVFSRLTSMGQIEGVNGLFIAPNILCPLQYSNRYAVAPSTLPEEYNININKQTTINGYTPKNKKLLTGEYNYLLLSNNNGSESVLHYEDFSNSSKCTFKVEMVITPGCSIRIIPTNFKNISMGDSYGINLGKFPICSYTCDMYTNWLTQNSINVMGMTLNEDNMNLASNILGVVTGSVGTVLGEPGLGGMGSYRGIADALISKKRHSLIPPETKGNLNAGDVVFSSGKNTFHFYKMSIKKEYAKIIDNFFNFYGYKVNDVKIPNITGRTNWNYVKTIGANIEGDIPEDHINELKGIFNKGVTLWHNASTYLDYSQSNNIV